MIPPNASPAFSHTSRGQGFLRPQTIASCEESLHFGSIRNAYKLIGYDGSRDNRWLDERDHWTEVLSKMAGQVAEALQTDLGVRLNLTDNGTALTRNGRDKLISFQVVRKLARRTPNHVSRWRAHLRKERAEVCVYFRLSDSNEAIQDYVLLSSAQTAAAYLTLSDDLLAQHNAVRVIAVSELIRAIKARMKLSSSASSAKPKQPNKRGKLNLPKSKNGRARHR